MRLVVGDIHGCLNTLRNLLEDQLAISTTDQLYFLGDYIDRGRNSSGVLDYILGLLDKGYQIYPLRGNHEENMLRAFDEYDTDTFRFYVSKFKSLDLLDAKGNLKKKYLDFMNTLPYYIELDDFFLVHAGFDISKPRPFDDKVGMLEFRNMKYDGGIFKDKHIVFGHNPAYLNKIIEAVNEKEKLIPLDNGCVYNKPHKIYDHAQLGQLCALDLDAFELHMQKNIEK